MSDPAGTISRPTKSSRIGESVYRVEDDRLLRGRAQFIDDIDVGGNAVHVGFVRSQHAHARIDKVDPTRARALPSVVAILTAEDFSHVKPIRADFDRPGFRVTERPVLATDRVRFVGDAVAMVLAKDPYAVADAIEAVEVDVSPLPCVTEAADAIREGAPRLYDHIHDNVIYEGSFDSPNFSAEHARAEFRLKERFTGARVAAAPMEPRGCIASFQRSTGTLTIWSSTQSPHLVRASICENLSLPESDVRVISPDVGGGFGPKTVVYPEEIMVAAAAIRLGVPVKWVQDRYDDLLTTAQARDHSYEVEVGFDRNGVLTSLSADILVNIGAYSSLPMGASLEANGASRHMPGAYALKHFSYRTRAVATNTCPTGPYRGVAAPLACFAIEGMLERIAKHLQLDPAEVRRRDIVSQFPFRNVLGQDYSEGCFGPAFERGLEVFDYQGMRRRQAENKDPNVSYGIGLAVVTEQTGMGASRYKARGILRIPGFESAHVKMEPDGTLIASISQAAMGQGNATAFSQIVSDVLGVPIKDIRIVEGDTGRTPAGSGTFASRGMAIAGNAVLGAAIKVRDKMARIAAHMLECDPGDVRFGDGCAYLAGAQEMNVSLKTIASAAYSLMEFSLPAGETHGLETTEYYDPPTAVIASLVHIASVAIDRRTGNVTIDRYVVVHDCGRMVNPVLVDGQIHGGIVQSLGQVLMEQIRVSEDGQPLAVSLMDYQLPRCIDVMPMEIEAMHSELGAQLFKGIGEGGTIGAVPALANAVADALAGSNATINSLPLTAKRIRALMAAS